LVPVSSVKSIKANNSKEAEEFIITLENCYYAQQYKFGILYMTEGQENSENLIYANNLTSPEFQEFLTLIGDKVPLEGWNKFNGGLSVQTGSHSIYTQFSNYEIMFHVSPMLPFDPNDDQSLERKRHLGNDITLIVFQNPGAKFDVTAFSSQFTHVYFVVEPVSKDGIVTHYKINTVNKNSIPPYSPFIKKPATYEKNLSFRTFLLTKLINSERAALQAPSFKNAIVRTRKELLINFKRESSGKVLSRKKSKKK